MYCAGVTNGKKQMIVELMGMQMGDLPVKYLGVPLITTRLRKEDCQIIKEKMVSKISHWAVKNLTYAGR